MQEDLPYHEKYERSERYIIQDLRQQLPWQNVGEQTSLISKTFQNT